MGRAVFYKRPMVLCLPLLISYLFVLEVQSAEGGSARRPGHPEGGSSSYTEEQQRLPTANTSSQHLVHTKAIVHPVSGGGHATDQHSGSEAGVPASENLDVGEGTPGPNSVHEAKQGYRSSADSDGPGEMSDLLQRSAEDDRESAADRRGTGNSGQRQPASYPVDPSSSQTSAAASSSGAKISATTSGPRGLFSRAGGTGGEQSLTIDVHPSTGEMSSRSADILGSGLIWKLPRIFFHGLLFFLGLSLILGGTIWAGTTDPDSVGQFFSGLFIFVGIVIAFIDLCHAALSGKRHPRLLQLTKE